MKQAKNTRHRNMLRAFTSGDYDRIDTAIRELEAVNDEVTWVAMLRDCLITKDGVLIASEELTVSGNRQCAADYGILELIGRIPKGLETNPTIKRGNIKTLRIRQHEGQAGVFWSMARFPTGIYRLPKLRSLNLTCAGFETLPEGISTLGCLEELILSHNLLEKMPADLGGCASLRLLDLGSNRLTSLPEGLGNLQKLEHLLLKYNRLTSWPPSLSDLPALNHLDLSYNELAPGLPPDFGRLKTLKSLFLNGNPGLQQLPAELADLPELKYLRLERCPALKPTPNRRKLSGEELHHFLIKLRRSHGQVIPNNRKPRIPDEQMNLFTGTANAKGISRSASPTSRFPAGKPARPQGLGKPSEHPAPPPDREKAPTHELLENLLSYFRRGDKAQETAGMQLLRTLDDDDLYRAIFDRWNTALLADDNESRWRWAFRHGFRMSKRQLLTLLKDNENQFLTSNYDLTQVTELALNAGEAAIPGILSCFPSLKELEINLHQTALPADIEELRQLDRLKITGAKQKRPLQWVNHTRLTSLLLDNCQIPSVRCDECPELTEFVYNSGQCNAIDINNCPALESLSVGNLNMDTLQVKGPCDLHSLCLSGTLKLKKLELPSLRFLRILNIRDHLDEKLLAEAMSSERLEELYISNPTGYYGMTDRRNPSPILLPTPVSLILQDVVLKNIGMQDFPLWVLDQPELMQLDLSHNNISVIPVDWSGSRMLNRLDIFDNLIPAIPPGIRLPPSLESIDLSHNRLKKIPVELAALPNLRRLSLGLQSSRKLSTTTLTDIPSEISMKPGLELVVSLRRQDWRRMRARNAAVLMHQGLPWEDELTRDWDKRP